MERKPNVVGKGRPIDRYTFGGWLIYRDVRLRDYELVPRGKAAIFGLRRWVLGPSLISERVGAPGKIIPSATTSRVGSSRALSLFLRTALPEPLVSPFEEELLLVDSISVLDLQEPEAERKLPLEHPSASSSSRLLSRAVTTSSSMLRILGAEEHSQLDYEGVGRKDRHRIRDFLMYPKSILWGNVRDHSTIN
ncbi:hypothetical protein Cgig2_011737 [Carnegiea gigantea]|uniref:Uncharacterized protein n=1 Tax=Carnegiea gigantea TaxID=171969 RepID=A0A9Q1KKT3_9CARY|nr:hypothetical protein Cgig2_011737 [Carnegiea gigantea]